MENLDKNVLRLLALDLAMPDILKLCLTSKKFNSEICKNNNFWRNKLYRDYPQTINKFPGKSDFRKIYLSLYNKVKTQYYTIISYNDEIDGKTLIPKFWSYIKKSPLKEEDYDLAEKLYPDFIEREGEDFGFNMIGVFPKGTKIFLAYCDDRDFDFEYGFLSRKEAEEKILDTYKSYLKYIYDDVDFIDGETPKEFYGGTFEEVTERNKKILEREGYLSFFDETNKPINFIIKEFELIDYEEILKELKRTNPNWAKLPKDMINYILKFLPKD
jgi:hypothetical protein